MDKIIAYAVVNI